MEMDSSSLSASDVAPMEDSVMALMEFLVDPMLPLRHTGTDSPPIEQQQKIAKQMHAVVLLYNYYQRKRHQELEFLDFESFCKLAVTLRPSMIRQMKVTCQSNKVGPDDVESQLSITERAIMDACKLCLALDVLKDGPSLDEWPISKVAVLLTDFRKEKCNLVFGSVTHGVWSVLEKDIEIRNISSGSRKRKRQDASDNSYQQLAFSAVSEATGINETDLMVLESHVVYSLSKERTAALFYIVKCTSSNEDLEVPIKDVVESLRGPLVKKISGSWTVTPVVEYFHVFPYAGIVSNWFSRKESSDCLEDLGVRVGGATSGSEVSSILPTDSPNKITNNGCEMAGPTCLINRLPPVEYNGTSASVTQEEDQIRNARMAGKVYQYHKKKTFSTERDVIAPTIGAKTEAAVSEVKPVITNCKDRKFDTADKSCSLTKGLTKGDGAVIPFQINAKSLEKIQSTLAAKENEISETALRVLLRKREILTRQLRNLGDEIATCDKNIQIILDGGEDNLCLKIDTLIQCCNELCGRRKTQAQDSTGQPVEDRVLPQRVKEKRLSEATLAFRTPCQELDDVCYGNNWTLPSYRVSPSDGGFLANATLKGMDFELSCGGDVGLSPLEARESAATKLIAKLRSTRSK